jgi:tRNA (guanine-N7-)-methyltransferase
MRQFPYEYESRREVLFYPEKPDRVGGDILEIGPGRGDLLFAMAEKSPEKEFVAIEYLIKRYFKLIKRIERLGLQNILLIQGRAQIVMPRLIAPDTFGRVYVMFPDPWPKERHAPHRLLTVDFLNILACTLKAGGDLVIATDFRPYAEWVVENAQQVPSLENAGSPYCDSSAIPDYAPTFFEQKWRDQRREIYYMRFRKLNMGITRAFPKSPEGG